MLREGPIPRVVHGLLEYVLGGFLVAAPFLLGYDDLGRPLAVSITTGVLVLVLAATSEGPTGLVRQVPIPVHVTIDVLLAVFLIAGPFLLGFGGDATPRNLFIALGVVHLLGSIGTRFRAADEMTSRSGSAGRVGPSDAGSAAPRPPRSPSNGGPSTRRPTEPGPPGTDRPTGRPPDQG